MNLLLTALLLLHIHIIRAQRLLYSDNSTLHGQESGAFGIAVDPFDQSVYLWGQGNGTKVCGPPATGISVYLYKFNPEVTQMIWCRSVDLSTTGERASWFDFLNGNTGPIIDPNSGLIYVYGTLGSYEIAQGLFLSCFDREGNQKDSLIEEQMSGHYASGLVFDGKRYLYAGSVSSSFESTIRKFDLHKKDAPISVRLTRIYGSYVYQYLILAMTVHEDTLFFAGFDKREMQAYFAPIRASNLTRLTNSPFLMDKSYGSNMIAAMAVDPARNAIYLAGSDISFSRRTLWRYSLNSMRLASVSRLPSLLSKIETFSFIAVHSVSGNVFCGGIGYRSEKADISLTQFPPTGESATTYWINLSIYAFGYAAAFSGIDKSVLLVASSASNAYYNYDLAIFSYEVGEPASIPTENSNTTLLLLNNTQPTVRLATDSDHQSSSITTTTTTTTTISTFNLSTVAVRSTNPDDSVISTPIILVIAVGSSIGLVLIAFAAVFVFRIVANRRIRRNAGKISNRQNLIKKSQNESFYELRNVKVTHSRQKLATNTTVMLPSTITVYSNTIDSAVYSNSLATTTRTLQTNIKELSVPGSYMVESVQTACKILNLLSQTTYSTLSVARPISQELTKRSGGRPLVVKMMRVSGKTQIEAFFIEISVMYLLKDCNDRFVEFIGFTMQPYYSIISIFYPNESLDVFLYGGRGAVQTSRSLIMSFASQIAEAIQFMHHNGFAHCDLKPHNVFIESYRDARSLPRYKCKLGDFGFVQILDDSHSQVAAFDFISLRGMTLAYAAPEAIRRFRKQITIERRADHYMGCDIYALAIVMYELSICKIAWSR